MSTSLVYQAIWASNYSIGIFALELLLHVTQEEAEGVQEFLKGGGGCSWLVHLDVWHHCVDGDHHRCKLLGGSGPMHPKKFPILLSNKIFPASWRKFVKAWYTVRSGESILSTSKSNQQHTCTVVAKLGSITSCCLGKDPALLFWKHSWTLKDSFVSLNQSDNRPQIFVGHKLSCLVWDGRRCRIDKWRTRELHRQLRLKVQNSQREMPLERSVDGQVQILTTRNARQVCQWPRCVPFLANRVEKV